MKLKLKTLLPVISLAVLVLSACNSPSTNATPTSGVSAIYTAAAETIVAQATLNTQTPTPTGTVTPTPTLVATATVSTPIVAAPTTSVSQGACDNSVYVSDVTIPDNTVVAPGEVFDKTWALMNTGACAWTTSYTMTFVGGDKLGGSSTAIGQAVAAQKQANVTVKLTAPTAPGTYTGYWRLSNSQGAAFGQQVSVVIVVSGSASTATATTGAVSASNTPAASTATATTAPAATATMTPTVTSTP